jgi:hypothetical protein
MKSSMKEIFMLLLGLSIGCTNLQPDTKIGETAEPNEVEDIDITEFDVLSLSGSITWVLDFDAEAESNGYTDCQYKRDYIGIEDWSAPWLCSDCESVFLVDVDLSEGLEDCYQQIATEPSAQERLGWTQDDLFRRGAAPAYAQTEQGLVTWNGSNRFTTSNQVENSLENGNFMFDIIGDFELAEGTGDPMQGWTIPETYDCGWPKADPEPYSGSYDLEIGGVLPDGIFADQCGQPVRLHDFKGQYLIVDISAENCPPCQSMAEQEPAFKTLMAENDIEVTVITLLAPSLSAVLDPTPTSMLLEWADTYGLHDPVLADRGWGYWLGNAALGDGFGYPTWIVIDPELVILDIGNGFSSWDDIATLIQENSQQ